jgi:hypothetical protein
LIHGIAQYSDGRISDTQSVVLCRRCEGEQATVSEGDSMITISRCNTTVSGQDENYQVDVTAVRAAINAATCPLPSAA